MSEIWDQARLERYITEGIEESLMLDYKAAASLDKSDKKKIEITKDVSAMANSAGGILIYGIAEFQDNAREHLPERLDPVDRTVISKEWLEQIIGNIQPRIDGVIIHPLSIDSAPSHVVYVVEIPQSYTAHQAKDHKYYKRFNFMSVPMEDYEIRDVMGRQQYARIELDFRILVRQERETDIFLHDSKLILFVELYVKISNAGKVIGQYIEVRLDAPVDFYFDDYADVREYLNKPQREVNFDERTRYTLNNTVRDYIKGGGGILGSPEEYGPARYVPLLPGTDMVLDELRLTSDFEAIDWMDNELRWTVYVDNAPPNSGAILIRDIVVVDKRHQDRTDPDYYDVFD